MYMMKKSLNHTINSFTDNGPELLIKNRMRTIRTRGFQRSNLFDYLSDFILYNIASQLIVIQDRNIPREWNILANANIWVFFESPAEFSRKTCKYHFGLPSIFYFIHDLPNEMFPFPNSCRNLEEFSWFCASREKAARL